MFRTTSTPSSARYVVINLFFARPVFDDPPVATTMRKTIDEEKIASATSVSTIVNPLCEGGIARVLFFKNIFLIVFIDQFVSAK